MTDIQNLKNLAQSATPGPWECREADGSAAICHAHGWVADDFSEQTLIDTRYMAAANPAAVLDLIERVERLERKNAKQSDSIREYQDLVMGGDVSLGALKADLRVTTGERDQLKAENERLQRFETAYKEFSDKTDWVQESAHWSELGMHRADVLRKRCEDLTSHNQAQADEIVRLRVDVDRFDFIASDAESGLQRIYGEDWLAAVDAAMGKEQQP